MTDEEALKIARGWIAAWNSHDIDRILSHYSDTIELTSPLVSRILGAGFNVVSGKAALRGLRGAEFMRIDGSGRVCQVIAHYAAPEASS
jgi:ketosteroid isomerase-like protein